MGKVELASDGSVCGYGTCGDIFLLPVFGIYLIGVIIYLTINIFFVKNSFIIIILIINLKIN